MADPVAVLVVPADGDAALLADGPCGASVPCMRRVQFEVHPPPGSRHRWPWTGWVGIDEPGWSAGPVGLLLWLDGALVPEGYDRARRMYCGDPESPNDWPGRPTVHDVQLLAGCLVGRRKAGRVVLLDRIDDRLVERVSP